MSLAAGIAASAPPADPDHVQVGNASQGDTATQQVWRYGALGFPLAFVALPLYVVLPNFYARTFGLSLASLGALLLAARLLDAVIDPLLGRWSDHLYSHSRSTVLRVGALCALVLWLGFSLLFFPPAMDATDLLWWAGMALVITYTAYSALSILHQSWGAKLGGDEVKQSSVVAWREGLALAGVLVASVAPGAWGLPATSALLATSLALAWWAWSKGPLPLDTGIPKAPSSSFAYPFKQTAFRHLFAVFVVNGIASAIPATLLLFFVQDRLQADRAMEPVYLGSYFLCAALAMPLWLRLIKFVGLARTWLTGMLLSVAVFVFAAQLGAGDSAAFIAVCALSGIALGTDLAVPGALLAGTIARAGDSGNAEGSYFGWWNFASKLNLALAAGLALPVLGWMGYTPGARDAAALQTLTLAYCLIPCALKLVAGALLYTLLLRKLP